MRKILLAALLFAPLANAASEAMAAHTPAPAQCDDRDLILAWLAQEYQEVPVAIAITDTGYVFEITRSAKGETYSVLLRGPGGPACIVGSGRDWQDIPFAAPSAPAS